MLRGGFVLGFVIRECESAGESARQVRTGGRSGLESSNEEKACFCQNWLGYQRLVMVQDKDVMIPMNCWILGEYGVFGTKLDLDMKPGSVQVIWDV